MRVCNTIYSLSKMLEREQNERDVLEAQVSTIVTPECLSRMCLQLLA